MRNIRIDEGESLTAVSERVRRAGFLPWNLAGIGAVTPTRSRTSRGPSPRPGNAKEESWDRPDWTNPCEEGHYGLAELTAATEARFSRLG